MRELCWKPFVAAFYAYVELIYNIHIMYSADSWTSWTYIQCILLYIFLGMFFYILMFRKVYSSKICVEKEARTRSHIAHPSSHPPIPPISPPMGQMSHICIVWSITIYEPGGRDLWETGRLGKGLVWRQKVHLEIRLYFTYTNKINKNFTNVHYRIYLTCERFARSKKCWQWNVN